MLLYSVGALLLSATFVSAKTCSDITIPVDIEARNGVFGKYKKPVTNSDAIAFNLDLARQGINFTDSILTGYTTISGRYHISAQYCTPENSTSKDVTLQILTHGIGFDKTYWDLSYNNYNYSYVDYALSQGYHTLSYDRLGLGNSSHGDALSEIQAFPQVAALAEITSKARHGSLPGVSTKASKVVHVGHSFGSAQTFALTAVYPDLSDGIVLTGFSTNTSFMAVGMAGVTFTQANNNIESTKSFQSRGLNYTAGYLTNANIYNNEFFFLYPGNFDPKIAIFAEKNKQPATVGEYLTASSGPHGSEFTGPVLIVTGAHDVVFCGGDCYATGGAADSIPAAAKPAFPKAKAFEAHVQPNTGHGLNLHYNATGTYKTIGNFLKEQGL